MKQQTRTLTYEPIVVERLTNLKEGSKLPSREVFHFTIQNETSGQVRVEESQMAFATTPGCHFDGPKWQWEHRKSAHSQIKIEPRIIRGQPASWVEIQTTKKLVEERYEFWGDIITQKYRCETIDFEMDATIIICDTGEIFPCRIVKSDISTTLISTEGKPT